MSTESYKERVSSLFRLLLHRYEIQSGNLLEVFNDQYMQRKSHLKHFFTLPSREWGEADYL